MVDESEASPIEYEKPRPQTHKNPRKKHIDDENLIVSQNSEDVGKLRKTLFQVFGGVLLAIFLYVMAQTVLDDVNFLGSRGSIKADSLAAIDLQNQFYVYFWNSTPELKKTKQVIDDTKKTLRELQEMKDKAKQAMNQFFSNDKVQYIKKQLPQNFSTKDLEDFAKRYGSKLEWILKANGLKNKEDIKKLDSLFIPKAPPKTEKKSPTPTPKDTTASENDN
jgi:hypothetical protein